MKQQVRKIDVYKRQHMMSFGKDTKFEIKVQNGGETVHSMKELVPIANKYLNEMKQE